MPSTPRSSSIAVEAPMLLAVARTLAAHRSVIKATIEKLYVIAERARGRLFKAYAEHAIRELAKLSMLGEAAANALGARGLSANGNGAEVLGKDFTELAVKLEEALDQLSRRVDRVALLRFTEVAEPMLRIASLQEKACAKAVELLGLAPQAAALLERAARDLLRLADDMKLMRRVLLARMKLSSRWRQAGSALG